MTIENKKILLFGGSGALGNAFIEEYIHNNKIVVYSRDEAKHWKMNLKFQSNNLSFIIGDIRDPIKVKIALLRVNPELIIIMSALKHIEKCEFEVEECMKTNYEGTINILNDIDLTTCACVIYVSSDKACEPTNVYGMSKALGEALLIQKSFYDKTKRYVNVRYGNVLNSTGSIIPTLHERGKSEIITELTLTDPGMTRFVMTLKQSIKLLEFAYLSGKSGDTIIPKLVSCKILDMMQIFSSIYNKPVRVTGIRPGEKLLESLISEIQSLRLMKYEDGYLCIKPSYTNYQSSEERKNYNSGINPLSKSELEKYLKELELI